MFRRSLCVQSRYKANKEKQFKEQRGGAVEKSDSVLGTFNKIISIRQIRRMIAVMLAVSRGAMTIEEVEHMLTKPNVDSWNPRAVCAPPWALYLLDVSYNPLHLNPQYWQDHDPVSPACAEEDLRATYALY